MLPDLESFPALKKQIELNLLLQVFVSLLLLLGFNSVFDSFWEVEKL